MVQPSSTPDPRTRILNHMNADHQDSLVRYLEHYSSLPSRTARHARLTDISLTSMTIATSRTSIYRIPFDPPLKDWSETRPRVVDMDAECRTSLGRDEITLKDYMLPRRGYQVAVTALCILTYLVMGRRATLAPAEGSVLKGMSERYPAVFAWLWRVQPWALYPLLVTHVVETVVMDRTRLRRHSVPRLSGLWWKWFVSTFVEGFGAFHRVDEMIAGERKKKEKAKH